MNVFEVRQYGVRYCQCGLRDKADEIASMHPGRTVHLIVPPIEPETIDISAEISSHHSTEISTSNVGGN